MNPKTLKKYTIVQHSAMGYKKDTCFAKGLESRSVVTPASQKRVQEAGGLLFDEWEEAEAYAEKEMYQPDNKSLIPNAPGTFSKHQVEGLALYIPVTKVEA